LQGIFGIMHIAKHSLAHAENHWTMTVQQRLKGHLIPAHKESLQQLGVGRTFFHGQKNRSAKMSEDVLHVVRSLVSSSARRGAAR
jgi:hypothetical protein